MALLMSLILGSGLAAFTSNSAFAQNYGYADNYSYDNSYSSGSSYGDSSSYSTYPTDDKPYECRTGPFEGFFVSSVEFCKHIKFDKDDRKDHNRDRDNKTGTQGPPGPAGPQGPPGANGTQGPAGLSTINTTNIYTNKTIANTTSSFGATITSVATCDVGDTALSGSFALTGTAVIRTFEPLATENGWTATATTLGGTSSVTADVVCFDNPPPHVP